MQEGLAKFCLLRSSLQLSKSLQPNFAAKAYFNCEGSPSIHCVLPPAYWFLRLVGKRRKFNRKVILDGTLKRKKTRLCFVSGSLCFGKLIAQGPQTSKFMDKLPVEILGKILSRLHAAHDIVRASLTSKKWRDAAKYHLHALCFSAEDSPVFADIGSNRLEMLITQTIFQTKGLRSLSVCMSDSEFSTAPVIAWLMYTKDTLRSLEYIAHSDSSLNILDRCGRHILESLSLGYVTISAVEPTYQRFPALKSLSLQNVTISGIDMGLLLTMCPKLENFSLIDPDLTVPDGANFLELTNHSLRKIYVEDLSLDKLVIEADSLEVLHLKVTTIDLFEVINKGSLKELRFHDVSIDHLDIGEATEGLRIIDVCGHSIRSPKFNQMILRAPKLRSLRIWEGSDDVDDDIMDLETLATCFPKLESLSLSYELRDNLFSCGIRGLSLLENVKALELGSSAITDLYAQWIAAILKRCPNLSQLKVYVLISEAKPIDNRITARFFSSMVRLGRKFPDVEIQFHCE